MISSEIFLFSPFFTCQEKPSVIRGVKHNCAQSYHYIDYLFIYLAFPCRERDTATGFPNYSRPFVVEEVTVHNTGISLLLSTSVWVLLSTPIESRETRPTA